MINIDFDLKKNLIIPNVLISNMFKILASSGPMYMECCNPVLYHRSHPHCM